MIKYLGSKRTLLPSLVEILLGFPELTSVADVFSGTSRVGHAFKRAGLRVIANDHNAYAHCLARCYVATDLEELGRDAQRLLDELDRLEGRPGYFTQTFCEDARFFQPQNGARVDAIREAIEQKSLSPNLRSVLLTALMEAADRVDSTCGLQMAYVKQWAPRSYNRLTLRMPEVLPAVAHGRCEALQMDANEAVRTMDVDIAYVDPPYNQHSYLSNYHIWESLVLWDKPEVYGVARKRVDCRERKSSYNSRRRHRASFEDLIAGIRAPLLVVSFNNEGFQSRPEMERNLARHGEVFVITKDFKRYVGAQIGVYNPSGDKVGEVSHLRNEEYIYLVARPQLCERVPDALARLERLAARVDEGLGLDGEDGGDPGDEVVEEDRVTVVARALRERGESTRAELQAATGLSAYQTKMALDSLLGQGLARAEGERRKRYSICEDGSLAGS
ncbi:MAG: DNA adenine methylase [Enhygromyxa sp.]